VSAGSADDDYGNFGIDFFEFGDEIATAHVANACVEDDAMHIGESLQGFDRFGGAVGGDDVEFGGLDDELARGNATGIFTVDDKKAGPDHAAIMEREGRFGKGRSGASYRAAMEVGRD